MKGITLNIDQRYSPHLAIEHNAFGQYLDMLNRIGVDRVVHRGRNLNLAQQDTMEKMLDAVHTRGMKTILYTGIFGPAPVDSSDAAILAQRDKEGNILRYGKNAMMCPLSDYALTEVIAGIDDYGFDGVFFDIPWIMKGGCHCANHGELSPDNLVRDGLEIATNILRLEKPGLSLAVNASAPGVYRHNWIGANIDNLVGLFDEYVTEWNPFRVGQKADVITRCVREARETVSGDIYHATTLTDKNGKMYSVEQMSELLFAILKGGASPWLGIAARPAHMHGLGVAWRLARERHFVSLEESQER